MEKLYQRENGKLYSMPVTFGPAICEVQNADGIPYSGPLSQATQYVMAYRVDLSPLHRILPEGFLPLRPVLRINIEQLRGVKWLSDGAYTRIELNTPVEYKGKRGWFNLVTWEDDMDSILCGRDLHGIPKLYADITTETDGSLVRFQAKTRGFVFLDISHNKVGVAGGCPKEADNEGTFHFRSVPRIAAKPPMEEVGFTQVEQIDAPKEYCDCTFHWNTPTPTEAPTMHRILQEIASIPPLEILGAYTVEFDRWKHYGDQITL